MRHAVLFTTLALTACGTDRLVPSDLPLVEALRPPAPTDATGTFGLPNRPPEAVLRLIRGPGPILTGSPLRLDASQSVDPDGDALTFDWSTDTGDLAVHLDTAELRVLRPGQATVRVRVRDALGAEDEASLALWVDSRSLVEGDGGAGGGGGGSTGGGAGGGPGGEGCPAPLTYGHADAARDVTLSNADIIASAASIENGQVDLRVQFCGAPFPQTATHNLTWCLDTNASGDTNRCGVGSGADAAISVWGRIGRSPTVNVGAVSFDGCQHLSWDRSTHVLRLVLPLEALGTATAFQYKLGSVFGGSSGGNDWSPTHQLAPGMLGLSPAPLPTFNGVSVCGGL